MKKIVKNAILVDKNINKVGEIKIEDGRIVEIGENLSFDDSCKGKDCYACICRFACAF